MKVHVKAILRKIHAQNRTQGREDVEEGAMKSSLLLVCGLILPVITGCGSSSATENVGTGKADNRTR